MQERLVFLHRPNDYILMSKHGHASLKVFLRRTLVCFCRFPILPANLPLQFHKRHLTVGDEDQVGHTGQDAHPLQDGSGDASTFPAVGHVENHGLIGRNIFVVESHNRSLQ